MFLIDTHTHLYSPKFRDHIGEVIDRALQAGVQRMLLPNLDTGSVDDLLGLSARYPEHCLPMLGLHPSSVKEDYKQELAALEEAISRHQIVAVGEIGIDLYWDKTFQKEQIEAFRTQLNWAKDLQLPVSIHCRNAFEEVFQAVEEEQDGRLRGVFHCFTGNAEQARRAIDLNLVLGIGGVVTFKNAGLDKALADIDIKHIVLETDSPYLAPVPYRGKQNESSYLVYIAEKLAEIYGADTNTIAQATTANAGRLFTM